MRERLFASFAFFVAISCVSVIGLVMAGCGDDVAEPMYDTAANPNGFPPAALSILDDISSGQLNDYESIAGRFEGLYGSHLELLDNEQWAGLITKLGTLFEHRADSLADSGIDYYYQASGLYTLAAFARPSDAELMHTKTLFDTWRTAVEDSTRALMFTIDSIEPNLAERIELMKLFYYSDSLWRGFAESYLADRIFPAESEYALTPQVVLPMRASEQAFLSYAGLVPIEFDEVLVTFEDPAIDLIDCKITPLKRTGWYRVELYYVPHEPLAEEYGVVFRLQTESKNDFTSSYNGQLYLPYDFRTLEPATAWKPDSVAVAVQDFWVQRHPDDFLIGLFSVASRPRRFVPIAGQEDVLFALPGSAFPRHPAR